MVGPEGRKSPSTVIPFIMWQQPHPIYLAELIYRDRPSRETLARYKDLVFETADLLASFVHFDDARGEYVLGPPIIPAQEVFPPLTTFNPTFELEYFRFGLETAQAWRERLDCHAMRTGIECSASCRRCRSEMDCISRRSLSHSNGSKRAARSAQPAKRQDSAGIAIIRRSSARSDLLPGAGVDRETMRRTLRAVETSLGPATDLGLGLIP